MDSSSEVT
uniref:Uncharacterized protein n=1 Tax=Rhizophora mucronata TaxID=61149 RepID=A0A2P2NLH3_RHIMU